MRTIHCGGKIAEISGWALVRLPGEASGLLPSRGMVMAEGTLNGLPFSALLEPDGKGGHWFRLEESLLRAGNLNVGDTVELRFSPAKDWREPELPADIAAALAAAALTPEVWAGISARAKWEWLRWIRSAKSAVTRDKRIAVAVDKLRRGHKRPCCFNSASCTEPRVSRNGALRED